MLPTLKPTRCRANVRATCRFHGAEDRALEAIKHSKIADYFDAMSELEALRTSNWDESNWGFIRPESRPVESLLDIKELLASKQVLADQYTATFEYGYAMRPAIVSRSAKAAKIEFSEVRTKEGVNFEFVAKNKRDLRFLKNLLEHNQNMREEDDLQAQWLAQR
jgi:hypothetical protein